MLLSMIRVFATSKGVVRPAAIPPAILPHTAAYLAGSSSELRSPSDVVATIVFRRSYSGNCTHVKGIYMTVSGSRLSQHLSVDLLHALSYFQSHDRSLSGLVLAVSAWPPLAMISTRLKSKLAFEI